VVLCVLQLPIRNGQCVSVCNDFAPASCAAFKLLALGVGLDLGCLLLCPAIQLLPLSLQ